MSDGCTEASRDTTAYKQWRKERDEFLEQERKVTKFYHCDTCSEKNCCYCSIAGNSTPPVYPECACINALPLDRNRNHLIAESAATEEEVVIVKKVAECFHCKKKHDLGANTFFTFYGDVMIGLKGGVIGGNFNNNGLLYRVQFLCRTTKCLEILTQYADKKYPFEDEGC